MSSKKKGGSSKPPSGHKTRVLVAGTESLLCELTQEEHTDRSMQMARTTGMYRAHGDHMKQEAARLKAEKERLNSEIHRLSLIVENHQEPREVKIHEVADFTDGLVRTIRLDREKDNVVRERPLKDDERQGELDGIKVIRGGKPDSTASNGPGPLDPKGKGDGDEPKA